MPETLQKLSPHRTIYLRGADGRGAAAAIVDASAGGFTVKAQFKESSDFAVVVLHKQDDYFHHPRFKQLPDTNFAGMVLEFDVEYTNLQPIDSPKFPTISWDKLEVIKGDGSTAQVKLFDHATQNGGTYTPATGTFTVSTPGSAAFDRVTLWYQNLAFDFIASGGETAADVADNLAAQINGATYAGPHSLSAVADGADVVITADPAGYDGNMIKMYGLHKTATLTVDSEVQFSGGSSDAIWHVELDFTALGIDDVREMWLTFAPKQEYGAEYPGAEGQAVFTNWTVTDPNGNRPMKVASHESVRIEESSRRCLYTGNWSGPESGFYSNGFARRSSTVGDSVTLKYYCSTVHDLYVGTALYSDRGKWGVVVDGDSETLLDCYLATAEQVATRRRVRTGLAQGYHTVTLTVRAKNPASSANHCYFDFLEAVAPTTDLPAAPGPYPTASPALDYDTPHGYQLSPAHILWIYDQLGFTGPMNEYIGVFWWNQRKVTGRTIPSSTVTFSGTFAGGESIFLTIGGTTIGKSVFPADTLATIAAHFAAFINETFSGVWASASGAVLTITSRAASAAFNFTFSTDTDSVAGVIDVDGALDGGVEGTWIIDKDATPVLNGPAAAWHANLYEEVTARSQEITTAFSMELEGPPDESEHRWSARYADGDPVTTATGFGSLVSTHCAFNDEVLAYQQAAFKEICQLQEDAGLTPDVQLGEFHHWFFPGSSQSDTKGMAFYDDETAADALAELGRELYQFETSNDDPAAHQADADFLRARLRQYVEDLVSDIRASYPSAKVELLYSYDVNALEPFGFYGLGGRLNHHINTPAEWMDPDTAPFDRIKTEALDAGVSTRSTELARSACRFFLDEGVWPVASLRYLFPLYDGGCPFGRERTMAEAVGIPFVVPFAIDHVATRGLDVMRRLVPLASTN